MKVREIILIYATITLVITFVMLIVNRNPLSKKDLMNTFTIGWSKGYEEGLRQNSKQWVRSSFLIDSCFMELEIHKIK